MSGSVVNDVNVFVLRGDPGRILGLGSASGSASRTVQNSVSFGSEMEEQLGLRVRDRLRGLHRVRLRVWIRARSVFVKGLQQSFWAGGRKQVGLRIQDRLLVRLRLRVRVQVRLRVWVRARSLRKVWAFFLGRGGAGTSRTSASGSGPGSGSASPSGSTPGSGAVFAKGLKQFFWGFLMMFWYDLSIWAFIFLVRLDRQAFLDSNGFKWDQQVWASMEGPHYMFLAFSYFLRIPLCQDKIRLKPCLHWTSASIARSVLPGYRANRNCLCVSCWFYMVKSC